MTSRSAIPPKLVIIEGAEKGKIIPIKAGTTVFGRSKGDVLIHDTRVSRSHMALTLDETSGRLSFKDLKSLNGTALNGVLTEEGELKDGDKLQLGNTLFDCQVTPFEKTNETSLHSDHSPGRPLEESISHSLFMDESDTDGEDRSSNASSSLPPRALFRGKVNLGVVKSFIGQRLGKYQIRESEGEPSRGFFSFPRYTWAAVGLILVGIFLLIPSKSQHNTATLRTDLDVITKLIQENRMDEVLAKTDSLEKRYAKDPDIYLDLGALFTKERKIALAISTYQKAHSLPSPPPMVHVYLLKLLAQTNLTNEIHEELNHIDEVIKNGPESKEFFAETAKLYLNSRELNQPPEKALVLALALENDLAPGEEIGYRLEAQALLQANRTKEALDALDKARKLAPDDEWVLENTAFAHLALHDVSGATEVLNSWLKFHPTSTKPMLVMAYLKFNDKDYTDSLPYLQKIIQLASTDPNEMYHAEAFDLMGKIALVQHQMQAAVARFKQGCEAGFQQSCENPLLKNPSAAFSPNGSASAAGVAPASISPPPATPRNGPHP